MQKKIACLDFSIDINLNLNNNISSIKIICSREVGNFMKRSVFLLLLLFSCLEINAQRQRPVTKPKTPPIADQSEEGNKAIVIDNHLSVLLAEPSLFARPIQRMRVGRSVVILGEKKADGVSFYQVSAPPASFGWLQADSVINVYRRNEDLRIVKLIQAYDDFKKIQLMKIFLDSFPNSTFRPAVLLLMGDLMEEFALKASKRATNSLDRSEMAASGAPLHSFYLSYNFLDRYRKMDIGFLFNVETKTIHYDGASWQEIVKKHPKSDEAIEATKRILELNQKMKAAEIKK